MRRRWVWLVLVSLLLWRGEVWGGDARALCLYAYGNSRVCNLWERLVKEYNKDGRVALRLYCQRGNPFEGVEGLFSMVREKPSLLVYPPVMAPFFGPRASTGSTLDLSTLDSRYPPGTYGVKVFSPPLYLGIWSGAKRKRALLDFLRFASREGVKLERERDKLALSEVLQWRPGGWWREKLMDKSYREPRTPVTSPMPYVKEAFIRRGTWQGYPYKAFVVEFDRPLEVLTTLEGFKKVTAVGNVYLYPALWGRDCNVGSLIAKAARVLGLKSTTSTFLFTGADMDNIAFSTERFQDLVVWVAATAGVMGNAMRAGVDEGKYLQKHGKWKKVGTVNIVVFVNRAMTPGAMANAIIRVTEAKTSVFEDLKIRSTYTPGVQATGTGTDNVMVVAYGPADDTFTSAGGHTKLGELIARGVREAVFKAVYNQNGIRPGRPSPWKGEE